VSSTRSSRVLRIVLVVYFLEAGAFLVMAPWGRYWTERIVARSPVLFQNLLVSGYLRGLLFGIGLLHIAVAVREIEAWRREAVAKELATEQRSVASGER